MLGENWVRILINKQQLVDSGEKQVHVLRLLCLLEYALASMNWYAGSLAGRVDLPPHESIIALSFNLSSVCEALNRFHELVREEGLTANPNWSVDILADWDFLLSEEVQIFKQTCLKKLRDKAVAHVDEKAIRAYIDKLSDGDEVVVYEKSANTKAGFSPLAADFIYMWMESNGLANEDAGKLAGRIYRSLQELVQSIIIDLHSNLRYEP